MPPPNLRFQLDLRARKEPYFTTFSDGVEFQRLARKGKVSTRPEVGIEDSKSIARQSADIKIEIRSIVGSALLLIAGTSDLSLQKIKRRIDARFQGRCVLLTGPEDSFFCNGSHAARIGWRVVCWSSIPGFDLVRILRTTTRTINPGSADFSSVLGSVRSTANQQLTPFQSGLAIRSRVTPPNSSPHKTKASTESGSLTRKAQKRFHPGAPLADRQNFGLEGVRRRNECVRFCMRSLQL